MVAHAKGCDCRKCRKARVKRFPNGCTACFVAPRVEGSRFCQSCEDGLRKHREAASRRLAELRSIDRLDDPERRRATAGWYVPPYELGARRTSKDCW